MKNLKPDLKLVVVVVVLEHFTQGDVRRNMRLQSVEHFDQSIQSPHRGPPCTSKVVVEKVLLLVVLSESVE